MGSAHLAPGYFYYQLIAESGKINYTLKEDYNISETGHDRWGNPELLKKGALFARNNFFAVILSAAIGLFVVDSPRIRQAELISGKFHARQHSLQKLTRALSTMNSVLQEDLLDENSRGRRFMTALRNRHMEISGEQHRVPSFPISPPSLSEHSETVLNALLDDAAAIPASQNVTKLLLDRTPGVTQFDISGSHYSFSCLLTISPKRFGIDPSDTRGLEAFMHLWAVVGSLLGIHDKFNCALHLDDTESQKRVYDDIMVPIIKYFNKESFTIPATIVDATVNRFIPIVRLNSIMYYLVNSVLGVEAPQLKTTLTLYDRAIVWILTFATQELSASYRLWVFGHLANVVIGTLG